MHAYFQSLKKEHNDTWERVKLLGDKVHLVNFLKERLDVKAPALFSVEEWKTLEGIPEGDYYDAVEVSGKDVKINAMLNCQHEVTYEVIIDDDLKLQCPSYCTRMGELHPLNKRPWDGNQISEGLDKPWQKQLRGPLMKVAGGELYKDEFVSTEMVDVTKELVIPNTMILVKPR